MSRDTSDPRESLTIDDFESNLTENESDEEADLVKKIEHMEKERQELEKRLKEKRELQNKITTVPSTPTKKSIHVSRSPTPSRSQISNRPTYFKHLTPEKNKHPSYQYASLRTNQKQQTSQKPHNTFAARLVESSKSKEQEFKNTSNLLESRVYSFGKPINPISLTCSEKESCSGQQITKRYIVQVDIDKIMTDKKILRIDKLCAKVNPPDFRSPNYANWVVVGIIFSKTEPKTTSDKKSKYMKITLGDFKINVDLMLFGDAFTKHWKVRVGDVIAILNPEIRPWKPSFGESSEGKSAKSFNLVLKNGDNAILEIGKAKYFGFCKSIRKDGAPCSTPIDTSKEEHCYFHTEMAFKKAGSKRMELNGSIKLFSPTRDGTKQQVFMGGNAYKGYTGMLAADPFAPKVDKETGAGMLYFSNSHAGKAFFDDEYQNPKLLDNASQRKRKMEDEKKDDALRKKINNFQNVLRKPGDKESVAITTEKSKIISAAFKPHVLSKIGFDPTRKIFEDRNQLKISSKYKSELVEDLKGISEATIKSKKLTKSKTDRKAKMEKWRDQIDQLEETKRKLKSSNKLLDDINFESDFDSSGDDGRASDSDSELDINFGNESNFKKYKEAIESKTKD